MTAARAMARAGRGRKGRPGGFTLVEVLLFIVIVGILGAALLAAFSGMLTYSGLPRNIAIADGLAQERMEIMLARRRALGYSAFIANPDPCTVSPQPPCTSFPAGYAVSSAISFPAANLAQITVTVTGPENATLTAQTANY